MSSLTESLPTFIVFIFTTKNRNKKNLKWMILNEKKIFGSKGKNTIFNKFVTDTLTKIAKTILAYSFVLEHLGILYILRK